MKYAGAFLAYAFTCSPARPETHGSGNFRVSSNLRDVHGCVRTSRRGKCRACSRAAWGLAVVRVMHGRASLVAPSGALLATRERTVMRNRLVSCPCSKPLGVLFDKSCISSVVLRDSLRFSYPLRDGEVFRRSGGGARVGCPARLRTLSPCVA